MFFREVEVSTRGEMINADVSSRACPYLDRSKQIRQQKLLAMTKKMTTKMSTMMKMNVEALSQGKAVTILRLLKLSSTKSTLS